MTINTIFFKKVIAIFLSFYLVFSSTPLVLAQETPPIPPTVPSAPEQPMPEMPEAPEAPSSPSQPTPPSVPEQPTPEVPEAPSAPSTPSQPTPEAPEMPEHPSSIITEPSSSDASANVSVGDPDSNSSGVETSGTGGQNDLGNAGDTVISTGNANNEATISNIGNSNLSTNGGSGNGPSASVANSGNGTGSSNDSHVSDTNVNNTIQQNSAQIQNDLNQSTITGDNNSSFNTGGDTIVSSGDANTTGTVLTSVNTNVDGVAVAEFNVADDHVGDIILDFNAGCISGCGGGSVDASNAGNGAYSSNDASADTTNVNNTIQDNDADIESNLTLVSDSGNNDASFNTGGDSYIQTGDANVSGNVITFANNNFAGNVIYSTVNIFGNLVGDIILSEEAMNAFCANCGGSNSASNSDNGAYSNNVANADTTNVSNTAQFNNADIENNLIFFATTGDNDTNFNTDGGNGISSGSANIDVNVLNFANNNLVLDGNVWLVIVNEAGQWVGKIFGEDGVLAASIGLGAVVDENGDVDVSNNGNGYGSDNAADVSTTDVDNISQTNDAKIVNNVNLSANTGGNTSKANTGGNSVIQTGDANVMANIVNFVNNNFVGTGKLFVTVVNVFGSWVGDLITPDSPDKSEGQASSQNESSTNDIGGVNYQQPGNTSSGSIDSISTQAVGEIASIEVTPSYPSSSSFPTYNYDTGSVASATITSDDSDTIAYSDSSEVAGAYAESERLQINLAWLLFLIPLYILVTIGRKKNVLSFIRK